MTHLYIEQVTDRTEEVNSSVIAKLYELATSGDLDLTSDLKGRLHSSTARDTHIAYFLTHYPDLHVTATTLYISFQDPEVDRVLTLYWGDGVGVTAQMIATHNKLGFHGADPTTGVAPFVRNTTIRTFNELGTYTTIKTIDMQAFEGSSIESIDLSNIEYIWWSAFTRTNLSGTINLPSIKKLGSGTGTQEADCFRLSRGITNVICGLNLELVGHAVFRECTSLQTVTGLSNVTTFGMEVFYGCTSLTSVDLNTDSFTENMFNGCSSLLTIGTWVNDTAHVSRYTFNDCENLVFPNELTVYFEKFLTGQGQLNKMENVKTFNNCKNLKKVILQGTDILLGRSTFANCTSLTEIVNTDKIKWIGAYCFSNCPISGTLDLSGCTGTSERNSGSDTPMGYANMKDMPNVTKIILGGWNWFAGNWATFDPSNRSFFINCASLTTVDFGIISAPFPNYRAITTNNSTLFCNCPNMTTLIIRNPSVLLLDDDSGTVESKDIGGPNVTLYVPDAIVNDYKTATGWSNIANQIKGISELPS